MTSMCSYITFQQILATVSWPSTSMSASSVTGASEVSHGVEYYFSFAARLLQKVDLWQTAKLRQSLSVA